MLFLRYFSRHFGIGFVVGIVCIAAGFAMGFNWHAPAILDTEAPALEWMERSIPTPEPEISRPRAVIHGLESDCDPQLRNFDARMRLMEPRMLSAGEVGDCAR